MMTQPSHLDVNGLTLLGQSGVHAQKKLETFLAPKSGTLKEVTLHSDEVTSKCPVTGQPDFYSVTIKFSPNKLCLESKSVKLYLQSFADDDGIFGEYLATKIAADVQNVLQANFVQVTVVQRPRGGVGITSIAQEMK